MTSVRTQCLWMGGLQKLKLLLHFRESLVNSFRIKFVNLFWWLMEVSWRDGVHHGLDHCSCLVV